MYTFKLLQVECSFQKCDLEVFRDFPDGTGSYPSSENDKFYDMFTKSRSLALPLGVVHAQNPGDVSEAIKFAIEHKLEISVKSTGHSYTGASTKEESLLLNISKMRAYSSGVADGDAIVECKFHPKTLQGAMKDACELATARNIQAVYRVGGGETWNDVLAGLSTDWNGNPDNVRKYHVISGAAATVGTGGGWLQSGGLPMTMGGRMYGLGIDSVLHLEMVLPDGRHVRFGPSKWDVVPEFIYPQTTEVTGYVMMRLLTLFYSILFHSIIR